MDKTTNPLSLRMKVRVNVPLEFIVNSGESLTETGTKSSLKPVMEELDMIRKMNVPSEIIEYRDRYQAGTEIRQVEVSVSQSGFHKDNRNYIVSYQTIRGKEIGPCRTYNSQQLRAMAIG